MSRSSSLANKPLIQVILDRYLYREQVGDLLDELEDDSSGSKAEVMRRLLQNGAFDPKRALRLLGKEQLAGLCRQRGKYDAADREILIQQLAGVIKEESGFPRTERKDEGTQRLTVLLWKELHPRVAEVARSRSSTQ
jgi:hypothetical protein